EPISDSEPDWQKALCEILEEAGNVPVILLTCLRSPSEVATAIRLGVSGYVCKPFSISRVEDSMQQTLAPDHAVQLPTPRQKEGAIDFIAADRAMLEIKELAHQIHDIGAPILITGESGVGKDVVARYIHHRSVLRGRPFVKVACANISSELIESELFGHKKGAFTGACNNRAGKFEIAHGGTIFLDEIGEMSPALQAKLLHVLQEGTFSRLGSDDEVVVNVRVIAATNRDLERALADGSFREDLFFRLNVINIEIPPLRERRSELSVFCDFFLEKCCHKFGRQSTPLPEHLLNFFSEYHWPGNVRELENVIQLFVILGDAKRVRQDLEFRLQRKQGGQMQEGVPGLMPASVDDCWDLKEIRKNAVSEVEKKVIEKALSRTNGNRWQAAKVLNVSYKTILNKIGEYDLNQFEC
ncbi:MAG TPA: sigma-54 dependent transcriptional regulator, partial [Acidobacteriota bacterium]|nr:sigma-54 dependent transcriptional regulator [Acidobacteriota bacterium]